jgi:uncharacterized membrane protein YdjX (TVP38/TMEM64 family)
VARYWTLAGTILALLLTAYLVVEALDVELLADPRPRLHQGGLTGAALGVGLLVADQLVPVPSSLVMISLGALYGAPAAILLALAGCIGMTAAGFAIGRAGGPLLARLVPAGERARADALLDRWGVLAVLVSRPMPLLAETVAIAAGASSLGWGRTLVAAALGALPEAVAYSLAGSITPDLDSAALIWSALLVTAVGFWWVGRTLERRTYTLAGGSRGGQPRLHDRS